MRDKKIIGERVYLTKITVEDAEDFVRWRNSDFIQSKFIYRDEISLEDQLKWIRTKVDTGLVKQFIIWDKAENKKIGCVYLQDIDYIKREAEFGILIGEQDYIGGGRGTESTDMIIKYAFKKLGLKRVFLRVLKNNEIARKSYEKAGFVTDDYQDTIDIDGKKIDVVFMSIMHKELN